MNTNEAKTILLICAACIATGLLVKNMTDAAIEQGLDVHIYSAPAITAEDILKREGIDALLIGPQSEYEIHRLKDYLNYNRVPYKLIEKDHYATFDGEKVLEQAMILLKK